MCGIAGSISFSGAGAAMEPVDDVVTALRHRGPDARGAWRSPDGTCVLGHARLSILDLSDAGRQPMVDPRTGNVIVFNGEIYDYRLRRTECESRGDTFHTGTDTEVILALYRRYGIDCVRHLRGMFAFAIWDASARKVVLARDRVGKKPLFYTVVGDTLVFASELQPLMRHPVARRDEDLEARDLYFQYQFIPAPWTIYRHVRKLEPAHVAEFDARGLRARRYWEVDYRNKVRISEGEALDALEDKLTESVRLRMIADVPVGALLSGGVDSSVVVALMAKVEPGKVNTYSIGFREEAFDELPHAERAAAIVGTRHHPRVVEGAADDLIPRVAKHYGEPYGDSSALPSFVVCSEARRHVTVALNGDGGDELLGGYPRYWLSRRQLSISRVLSKLVPLRALTPIVPTLARRLPLPARLVRRGLVSYVHPELMSALMFSGFWNDSDRKSLFGRRLSDAPARYGKHWLREVGRHADNPVDAMLWMDARVYLAGDLLPKMDIAAMQASLETRSPLLDHELIELCASFPVDLKVRDGIGKYLLKKLAEKWFPKDFVHRKKMGFGIPVATWLTGPLRPFFEQTLTALESAPDFSRDELRAFRTRFFAHPEPLSPAAWTLLMYGAWRKECVT